MKGKPDKSVLLVRWGALRIHDYFFALILESCGYEVTFAIYTPHHAYRDIASKEIRKKVFDRFEVLEETCRQLERQLVRSGHAIQLMTGYVIQAFAINIFAARRLSRRVATRAFNHIVPIEHYSLYYASKALPHQVNEFLYYSLEIPRPSDPGLSRRFCNLLEFERWMLSDRIDGLLVQDRFRAESLIGKSPQESTLRICYIPVCVPGTVINGRGHYFNERLGIPEGKRIILYFGAIYGTERNLVPLFESLKQMDNDQYVTVFHGSSEFRDIIPEDTPNVRVSEEFVPIEQIDIVLKSCDIGIALYDNHCLNTRLTAFSSEKITRYLQCGKPFIAFRNESTVDLQSQFPCCALIDDISELGTAIALILGNYEEYSKQSHKAFEAIFSQKRMVDRLHAFLENGCSFPRTC